MNILQFIKKQWMAFKEDLSNWKGQRHQRQIVKAREEGKTCCRKSGAGYHDSSNESCPGRSRKARTAHFKFYG